MKALTLAVLLFTSNALLCAQEASIPAPSRQLNSVQINLLGDASIISGNYERMIPFRPKVIFSSKLGIGMNKELQLCILDPCRTPGRTYFTVPHHITANFGKTRHLLEVGLGGTILIGNTSQPYILYPIVGYRFWSMKIPALTFRAFGQIPFNGFEDYEVLFIPVGISFGYSFQRF